MLLFRIFAAGTTEVGLKVHVESSGCEAVRMPENCALSMLYIKQLATTCANSVAIIYFEHYRVSIFGLWNCELSIFCLHNLLHCEPLACIKVHIIFSLSFFFMIFYTCITISVVIKLHLKYFVIFNFLDNTR